MQARARREAPRGVRVPAPPRRDASGVPPREPPDRPELRLALARGALAIELESPFELGPVRVLDLAVALPVLRFPVDLSGGVARFRHQRGELERLLVAVRAPELERLAALRWRGLLGEGIRQADVTLAPFLGGCVVGVAASGRALAFDLHFAPLDGGLRLLIDRARGMGLAAPPHGLALRALSSLLGDLGRVASGVVVVDDVAGPLLRQLLPLGGARLPSLRGVRASVAPAEAGWAVLRLERDAAPAALEPAVVRLLELADLVGEADDAAAAGDLEQARQGYLRALERAPRHPAIGERIAALDHVVGDRTEAALATLVEATSALGAGVLGAELLAAVGDAGGAHAAFARAAAEEPWSRLASLAWLEAARWAPDRPSRAHALDEALARAPLLEAARWERFEARLALGDLDAARADAELYEAGQRGSEARRIAATRAGGAFLFAGYAVEAARWFERALRIAPDDADAVLGLARALRDAGKPRRALDLFARAVTLAERRREVPAEALLELAKELVATAEDRPAAVARARAIPRDAPEATEALALEARWRMELGDRAGASLTAARLADALELAIEAGRLTPETDREASEAARAASLAAASVAREVAHLAETELGLPDLARRLLALAVRAAPRDRRAANDLRRLVRAANAMDEAPVDDAPLRFEPPGQASDGGAAGEAPAAPVGDGREEGDEGAVEGAAPVSPSAAAFGGALAHADLDAPDPDRDEDEALAARLTDRLRADPTDHGTAMALADVLTRLGQDMELLALVSARIDEGGDDVRADFAPVRRACLGRLANAARAAGRSEEADLYAMMADAPVD